MESQSDFQAATQAKIFLLNWAPGIWFYAGDPGCVPISISIHAMPVKLSQTPTSLFEVHVFLSHNGSVSWYFTTQIPFCHCCPHKTANLTDLCQRSNLILCLFHIIHTISSCRTFIGWVIRPMPKVNSVISKALAGLFCNIILQLWQPW